MSSFSTSLITTPRKAASDVVSNALKTSLPAAESFPPSPGTFRHPKLTEIIVRQSASTLTTRNVQTAMISAGALALTFFINGPFYDLTTSILETLSVQPTTFDGSTPLLLLRLYLIAKIILSLRPAIPYLSQKDEITDIPLTPSQRALLGLDPSTPTSVTGAGGAFVTPPRYRHTSGSGKTTPVGQSTNTRSVSGGYSSSPLNTSRNAPGFASSPQTLQQSTSSQYRRSSSGQFGSYSTAVGYGSPLQHKTDLQSSNNSDFDVSLSRSAANFGTSTSTQGAGASSSLGRSQSLRDRDRRGSAPFESVGPGTPSPSGRRAVAGVNYKWLYDKGNRLPRSESMAF